VLKEEENDMLTTEERAISVGHVFLKSYALLFWDLRFTFVSSFTPPAFARQTRGGKKYTPTPLHFLLRNWLQKSSQNST